MKPDDSEWSQSLDLKEEVNSVTLSTLSRNMVNLPNPSEPIQTDTGIYGISTSHDDAGSTALCLHQLTS